MINMISAVSEVYAQPEAVTANDIYICRHIVVITLDFLSSMIFFFS